MRPVAPAPTSAAARLWRASRAGTWLPPLVALGVVAGAWQLYASAHPLVLPTVPAVFDELANNPNLFVRDAGQTLLEVVVGTGCGFATAFLLAVAMSQLRVVERAVMPLAIALNVTPIVSIAPALTLMLGVRTLVPRYLVTALVVFFPFLVNALLGLRAADPAVLDLAHTLDANAAELLWRVRLPSALPFLFAAARVGVPLGLVGAVVAEFSITSAGNAGLGGLIWSAAQYGNGLPEVFAAILILALVGVALTLVVVVLERRVLSWHAVGGRSAR